jgi:predicted GNAT family N-acyltransferase
MRKFRGSGSCSEPESEGVNTSGETLTLRVATEDEIATVVASARARLSLASDAVLRKLRSFNPQIFQSIRCGTRILGLAAWLPLNHAGFTALLDSHLDTFDPDPRWLCSPGVKPHAAYCWYIHAPRRLARVLPVLVGELARLAPSAPIYARPVHRHAQSLLVRLGFTPLHPNEIRIGSLYHLDQVSSGSMAAADEPAQRQLSCRLAYTIEDLMKVFTVRAATYMHEQQCPYAEEFDGNDFCAAHFIGLIGDEPAGCIRVRFFAGFVKIERLAVRHEFRRSRLAFHLVRHAIAFSRRKGYVMAYGHCAADLIPFWRRFGFEAMPDKAPFAFSGVVYHEMIAKLDAEPACIAIGQDPYVLVRPEDRWDSPGPLDRSRSRHAVVSPRRAA